MSQGRLDILILNVIGHCVQTYLDPHARFPLWENGAKQLTEALINECPIPKEPVTHIYIGQLPVPIEVFQGIGRHVGILPPGVGNAGGS